VVKKKFQGVEFLRHRDDVEHGFSIRILQYIQVLYTRMYCTYDLYTRTVCIILDDLPEKNAKIRIHVREANLAANAFAANTRNHSH
jgi:hypothetical protein